MSIHRSRESVPEIRWLGNCSELRYEFLLIESVLLAEQYCFANGDNKFVISAFEHLALLKEHSKKKKEA